MRSQEMCWGFHIPLQMVFGCIGEEKNPHLKLHGIDWIYTKNRMQMLARHHQDDMKHLLGAGIPINLHTVTGYAFCCSFSQSKKKPSEKMPLLLSWGVVVDPRMSYKVGPKNQL